MLLLHAPAEDGSLASKVILQSDYSDYLGIPLAFSGNTVTAVILDLAIIRTNGCTVRAACSTCLMNHRCPTVCTPLAVVTM